MVVARSSRSVIVAVTTAFIFETRFRYVYVKQLPAVV